MVEIRSIRTKEMSIFECDRKYQREMRALTRKYSTETKQAFKEQQKNRFVVDYRKIQEGAF